MKIIIDNYEFVNFKLGGAEFVFSTAKNSLNFNKNLDTGKDNLNLIGKYFNLINIGYMEQVHSDIVTEYDEKINKGDAIITDKRNIGIGVFTADCVPVLIYDRNKKVVAAIHSGWKGTLEAISSKTVESLINKYGCKPCDLIVYIGPHNRACCYEFGSALAYKYFGDYISKDQDIYVNNKLNLEKCIISQLANKGIPMENINTLNLCTYCSSEYEFFSYRREGNKNYGRMFSFAVIR